MMRSASNGETNVSLSDIERIARVLEGRAADDDAVIFHFAVRARRRPDC